MKIGLIATSLVCAMLLIGFGISYRSQKSKSEATSLIKSKESVATAIKPVDNTNVVNIKKQETTVSPVEIKTPQAEDKKVAAVNGPKCDFQDAGIFYDPAEDKCILVAPPTNSIIPKDFNKYSNLLIDSNVKSSNYDCNGIKAGVTYTRKASIGETNKSYYKVAVSKSYSNSTSEEQGILREIEKFIKYESQDTNAVNSAFHWKCQYGPQGIYKELDLKIKGADYSRILLTTEGTIGEYVGVKILGMKNGVYFEVKSDLSLFEVDKFSENSQDLAYKQIQSFINIFETEFSY